jgi:hypothetical protein
MHARTLVAVLVAVGFWIWCGSMRNGAATRFSESRVRTGVLRDYAWPCVSVLVGLEWIRNPMLYPFELRAHRVVPDFTTRAPV